MKTISKPAPREYPIDSQIYMDHISNDGKVLKHLWDNFIELKQFLETLSEEVLIFKKQEWNWNIKETIMHLMDNERIYVYRALRYSRNDETPLRDYEPEEYRRNSKANDRTIHNILEEYELVRKSTIIFFNNLHDSDFRKGRSDLRNYSYRTVRAIVYYIAGYEAEQFQTIQSNLMKYLTNDNGKIMNI